uniref:Uncharacterized protein n=1 Tax=Arundo donax TaxID=35708 RepID=A0A0A9F129_ARUDO
MDLASVWVWEWWIRTDLDAATVLAAVGGRAGRSIVRQTTPSQGGEVAGAGSRPKAQGRGLQEQDARAGWTNAVDGRRKMATGASPHW